ncbi:hypothetical protein FF38_09089 [Lucilia cuprina]|uniref:Uncharacterized protein n=2 Tax=Lucilia cuprina TaxID=7375 RepID=A0A0L0CAG7_LUCCU|nr:uncharacterized protein LOC111681429 isoform X1 [Lucilia cuprina]KNC28434.1 hypothetical protein FF38_09089 [Lucilia cuprina]
MVPILIATYAIMMHTMATTTATSANIVKRSYSDQSVHGYMTERTCWWNEVCKEEFQNQFRCKCPQFSYCRSPGRYYNAYCSMTDTGYIWTQPTWDWGPQAFPNI